MLEEMRAFVMVAEAGSIARAAERLPLTQPAVTKQIQRLERALDVTLLDRRMKPPRLTPAGEAALARCRRILAEVDALRTASGKDAEPEGVLRFGISLSISDAHLAAIFGELRRAFPRVNLQLESGWRHELDRRLARGELDVTLALVSRNAMRGPRPADSRILGTDEIALLSAPALGLSRRPRWAELAEHPWILSPMGCEIRDLLATHLGRAGRQVRVAAEVQSPALQVALIERGFGLGFASQKNYASALARKAVTVHRLPGISPDWSVVLTRSPNLGPLARAVDALEPKLAAHFSAP